MGIFYSNFKLNNITITAGGHFCTEERHLSSRSILSLVGKYNIIIIIIIPTLFWEILPSGGRD